MSLIPRILSLKTIKYYHFTSTQESTTAMNPDIYYIVYYIIHLQIMLRKTWFHREAIETRPDEDELGDHSGECSKLQEAHTEKIKDLTGKKRCIHLFLLYIFKPLVEQE